MRLLNVLVIVTVILICMTAVLFIIIAFINLMDLIESQNFCEDHGGDGRDDSCLIEENGRIVQYELIKFKGEWRLQK